MRKGVMRPGHVQIRVLDMEEAIAHYRDLLGLIEAGQDEQGRVYFKGWTEVDKFSVVLREADSAGMDFMAFKVVDDATLSKLKQELEAFGGLDVVEIEAGELAGCGRRVRFTAPTGHVFELYADKEQNDRYGIGSHNPEAWPRDLKGMKATRFDHCLLYGDDLDGTFKLFNEVLGFDLAEQVLTPDGERIAQFLSVSMKAHDVAFYQACRKRQVSPCFVLPRHLAGCVDGGRPDFHDRHFARHRPHPPRPHAGADDLFLRPLGQPQRSVCRRRLPLSRPPRDHLGCARAGQSHFLSRPPA